MKKENCRWVAAFLLLIFMLAACSTPSAQPEADVPGAAAEAPIEESAEPTSVPTEAPTAEPDPTIESTVDSDAAMESDEGEEMAEMDDEAMHDGDNLIAAITNAPIVSDGLLTGRFPDFVIHFDIDMDPSVPGRRLMAGDQMRITLPDAFEVTGEPVPGDPFAAMPFNAYSWAALLQGWPQVPIFSSFPPGNLDDIRYSISMEGTHTMVITADVDLDETLPFPGPGIKQIHILFAHLVNPEAGTYEVQIESETGEGGAVEHGVGQIEISDVESPAIAFTSVFNGEGRPNAIYQTTQVGVPVAIPYHLFMWGADGEPVTDAWVDFQTAINGTIEVEGGATVGRVKLSVPQGANGSLVWVEVLSEEITAPISGRPAGHMVAHFAPGDTPGLYEIEFAMVRGNAVTAYVEVLPTSTEQPASRTWHGTAYDETTGRYYLVGGRNLGCTQCIQYGDMWSFDVAAGSWQLEADFRTDIPNGEFDRIAIDTESGKAAILWHGGPGQMQPVIVDIDSAEYAYAAQSNEIKSRVEPLWLYHPDADRMILFGGRSGGFSNSFDDTWLYDVDTNSWEQVETETAPSARWRSAVAYDSDTGMVLIYGGSMDFMDTLTDTWMFDIDSGTWTEIVTDEVPELEAQVTGAYDEQSQKFIVYGKKVGELAYETWAFDMAEQSWTNMTPATGPEFNHPGDLVYSPELDRVLLFGGNVNWPATPRTEDEFWAYDYDSNVWELFNGETWEVVEVAEE